MVEPTPLSTRNIRLATVGLGPLADTPRANLTAACLEELRRRDGNVLLTLCDLLDGQVHRSPATWMFIELQRLSVRARLLREEEFIAQLIRSATEQDGAQFLAIGDNGAAADFLSGQIIGQVHPAPSDLRMHPARAEWGNVRLRVVAPSNIVGSAPDYVLVNYTADQP